jgi:hypothetical protein
VKLLHLTAIAALTAIPVLADTVNTFVYNGTFVSTTAFNENVRADFIVSGGNLVVTLYDTTPNTTYDKQILTGVLFTYSGAGSILGAVTNPIATAYNINDANGVLTSAGSQSANWHTEVDLTGYLSLTNLNNNAAGSHGILSASTNPAGTNNLTGHEVYFKGPLQFTISGLGLTSSSQIQNVEFNFGTATGQTTSTINGSLATPEPSPFVLLGFGLIGISWIGSKRSPKP